MSNLKDKRQAAGLSQAQLAEKSGVSIRMIQYYEQGAKDINKAALETGIALSEVLGCDPKDLLEK